MRDPVRVLDAVAVLTGAPAGARFGWGQVGTAVEELAPGVFEIEFSDNEGRVYAILAINAGQLMVVATSPSARPDGGGLRLRQNSSGRTPDPALPAHLRSGGRPDSGSSAETGGELSRQETGIHQTSRSCETS